MASRSSTEKQGLSQEQVQEFWRSGFLVINDVFTLGEVERFREATEADAIRKPQQERGYDHKLVHLLEPTVRHPAFMELARDERIISMVRPLIGNDIQLQHSKLATQPPVKNRGGIAFHQDFAFFPHTNTDLVAVFVCLDDLTPDNGCMQMLPGSHKLGLLNYFKDGYLSEGCQEPQYWSDPRKLVHVTPRAGGVSIHHCLTLHGSPVNPSGKPRRGVIFEYRADDAYQLADMVFADTGLLVSGQRRGRVRCIEGNWQLPRQNRPDHPYGTAWNQVGSAVSDRLVG